MIKQPTKGQARPWNEYSILKVLPRTIFDAAVAHLHGEKHAKRMTCWSQFVAPLFCQWGGARSPREIIGGSAASEGKLRHLGIGFAAPAIRVIAQGYRDHGLERALYERPRKGHAELLDPSEKQRIIAMVCSQPPEGRARWTVRLISEEAVKRKLVPGVGLETIRILLQSHDLKPWRGKNWVRGRVG